MLSVSEIHVRRVSAELLRAVNVEAAKKGVTQREYVLTALAKATGWEHERGSDSGTGAERGTEHATAERKPARSTKARAQRTSANVQEQPGTDERVLGGTEEVGRITSNAPPAKMIPPPGLTSSEMQRWLRQNR